LPVKDAYIRDRDLIASFGAVSDWPYSPQIYWSVGAVDSVSGIIGSMSLIVSVQTHLLDTWPRIAAGSRIVSDETLRVQIARGGVSANPFTSRDAIQSTEEALCVVHRLRGMDVSYAEIMLASDFRDVSLTRDAESGEYGAKWTLFSEFMEKGVIRRARLVGVFLPRENDVELAAACCKAVERSPLPLTV
jgi:hypothetical protein